MLTHQERRRALLLAVAMTVGSVLETVSIGAALPLVSLVVQPDSVTSSSIYQEYSRWAGDPHLSQTIFVGAVAVTVLVLSAFGFNLWLGHSATRFGASCWRRLSHDLMHRCLHAQYAWFLGQNASVIARFLFHDVTLWSRDFVRYLLATFADVVALLFVASLMIGLAPGLGVMILVVVVVAGGAMLAIVRPRIGKWSKEQRAAADRIILSSNQPLAGIKDVKMSSREQFFVRKFDDATHQAAHAQVWTTFWSRLPPSLMLIAGQLGVVGLTVGLWASGVDGGMIAAYMALAIMASSRVIPAMNRLMGNAGALMSVAPFINGIHHLCQSLAEYETRQDTGQAQTPAPEDWGRIVIRDLGYTYPGTVEPSLRGVSFELEHGRLYGIVGPSGAGKSTLVDILLGLLWPTAGKIYLDGQDLAQTDVRSWQAQIGYVPQAPFLVDGTLRENVAFGVRDAEIDDSWIETCLRDAQLEDFLASLPRGLDTPLGDRGGRTSGGQKQRIAIARALYKRPRLLVLDEATSALDSVNEGKVKDAIQGLKSRVTVVVIAHRLATLTDADRIFLLAWGRLADEGTYNELLNRSAQFKDLAASTDQYPREAPCGP